MRIVHLSQTDAVAGAGRAAYRIHRALLESGFDSKMIVSDKRTNDASVGLAYPGFIGGVAARACAYLDVKYGRLLAKETASLFSPARFGYFRPSRDSRVRNADVVCLYWVNGGFVRPEDLSALYQPLVWRLSDIWPFSGGCHYSGSCERFVEECGCCPQLANRGAEDYSRRLWKRKALTWKDLDLTIVAPSQWIADLAARSSLFRNRRIEIIATGVDTTVFHPIDRMAVRAALGLPTWRRIIACGAPAVATDPRKGWTEFAAALQLAVQRGHGHDWHIAIFGSDAVRALPVPMTKFGRIDDDRKLAQLYAAADVVVVPSKEDNLPQVALEALSCGTPVLAYRVGGLSDAIVHKVNGWLAPAGDVAGLIEGLIWLLSAGEAPRQAARRCVEERFSQTIQIGRYISLLFEVASARRQCRR